MTNNEEDFEQSNTSVRFGGTGMIFSILCAIPVFLVVAHFAGLGRGRSAALCTAVDFAVVKLRWTSKDKGRLFAAAVLISLIQALVIAYVPFGDESLPAYALLPAAVVIYLMDEGIILLVGRKSVSRPK